MNLLTLDAMIEDYVLKDCIKSEEWSINAIESDMSFTSAQETCCNILRKNIETKKKQHGNECNSNLEEEESVEECDDEEEDATSEENDTFANEREEEDDNSEILEVSFDAMEEIQKSQDEIKLRIKEMDAMCQLSNEGD